MTAPLITALLVAGRRPGDDPLARHFGIADKALIPVNGEAMLSRVARTLVDHPAIASVQILAQEPNRLASAVPWMQAHPKIALRPGGNSVSGAVADAIGKGDFPFLLTTADNVLLTHAMIDDFIAGAKGHDVAVAMVERRRLLASYPESRRTWLKFRGGSWSGANLYWLGSPAAGRLLRLWKSIEQERKKSRAVIGAFGPLMLAAVTLRLVTIQQAVRMAGKRMGLDVSIVDMPQAEACIDVDKVSDHAMAERIIVARSS